MGGWRIHMPDDKVRSEGKPGAVLKALRVRRGWTLADVSAKTGLTTATLSRVENGKMSVTYDKLSRLSRGLEIDISLLFGDLLPAQDGVTGRRSINRAGEGRSVDTEHYAHLYAATDLLNKRFAPVVTEIHARSLEEFGELVSRPGEEYSYVLEGSVELHTSFYEPVRLNKDDSIYFDSGMGHAYIAGSEGPCRVLSICTEAKATRSAATADAPPTMILEPKRSRPEISPTCRRRVGNT
jgi:transcriptional regulator with XRE-family HTH domain